MPRQKKHPDRAHKPTAIALAGIGISRQIVNAQIKELERKGFIKTKHPGQGRPNIYEIDLTVQVLKSKR